MANVLNIRCPLVLTAGTGEYLLSENLFGDNTLNLACHYLAGRQDLSLFEIKNYWKATLLDTDNTDNH